jgi:predicted O-methyltransferase YrrM
VGQLGNIADYAAYATEDGPLLAARANADDLGGTTPVRPEVGAALRFIAASIGARTAVEIGTGCGTSGIWLLRGMRPGGVLTSVDTEPEYQRVARQAFSQAGFAANQARLILGRALDVLPRLSDGVYDLVFCDSDPRDYPDYLTAALRLLRPGGVVAFNDVLAVEDTHSEHEPSLRSTSSGFGDEYDDVEPVAGDGGPADDLVNVVLDDQRLIPLLLPLGEGMLAAVLRGT